MKIYNQSYLDVAFHISTDLLKTAIWDGEYCNWVGYKSFSSKSVDDPSYSSLGYDVFSGTSGIAFFLSYIYRFTNDPIVFKTVQGALMQGKHVMERHLLKDHNPSFYSGYLSLGQAFFAAGILCSQSDWKIIGLSILEDLSKVKYSNSNTGVLEGLSGYILGLVSYYNLCHGVEVKNTIIKASNQLISNLDATEGRIGYAFGLSGNAYTLMKVFEIEKKKIYLEKAITYLSREQNLIASNYFSKASLENNKNYSNRYSWINGAAGIVISRLELLNLSYDKNNLQLINFYMKHIVDHVESHLENKRSKVDFSLFQGLSGIGDILLYAGMKIDNESYIDLANRVAHFGIEKFIHNRNPYFYNQTKIIDRSNNSVFIPGLLTGIAGVGHFYLRLEYPRKITSVFMEGAYRVNL